jgi:heat shock protein HtpX
MAKTNIKKKGRAYSLIVYIQSRYYRGSGFFVVFHGGRYLMFWVTLNILVNWFVIFVLCYALNYESAPISTPIFWSIVIVAGLILFALSATAEKIATFLTGLRKPTDQEYTRLAPLLNEVLQKASYTGPEISLYVSNHEFVNACAIGSGTIGVTLGCINHCSEEEIKGLLAHELGHLALGHGKKTSIVNIMNTAGYAATWALMIAVTIVSIIIGFLGGRQSVITLLSLIVLTVMAVSFKVLLWLFNQLIRLGLLAVGRKDEYSADHFAGELGYSDGLIAVLERGRDFNPKALRFNVLLRTHPYSDDRIKRLKEAFE